MQSPVNKIFVPVAGRPILLHTLSAFARAPRVDEVVLVVRSDEEDRVREIVASRFPSVRIVPGGEARRDSAHAGVTAAEATILLIHDAARPFPSSDLIDRVIEGAVRHGACVPALSAVDTLRYRAEDGTLSAQSIERRNLVRVQTPQGFDASLIRRCLAASPPGITDDAGAVLAQGESVWTVPGEPLNLKITTPADLELAEAIYKQLKSPQTA